MYSSSSLVVARHVDDSSSAAAAANTSSSPTNVWELRRPGAARSITNSASTKRGGGGKASQVTTRPSSAQTRPSTASARNRPPQPTRTTNQDNESPSRCVSSLTLSSPTALLSSAPEWQAQFFKTKLCPFYVRDIPDARTAGQIGESCGYSVGSARGVCLNRETCRFAHSCDELRPLPDLRKTKLCSSYTKRVQCRTAKCPFAHSPQELRTSSSVFYKVTLCNFYKNGRCWNGANCRFAHGCDELRGSNPSTARQQRNRVRCEDGLLPTPVQRINNTPPSPPPPPPAPTTNELQSLMQELSTEQPPSWQDAWGGWEEEPVPPPPGFNEIKPQAVDTEALLSLLLPSAAELPPSTFSQSTSPSRPPSPNRLVDEESLQQILEALTASIDPPPPPPETEDANYQLLMQLLKRL